MFSQSSNLKSRKLPELLAQPLAGGTASTISLGESGHIYLDFAHLSSPHQCWIEGHDKTIKLCVNCQKRSLFSFPGPELIELLSPFQECLEICQGPFTVPP